MTRLLEFVWREDIGTNCTVGYTGGGGLISHHLFSPQSATTPISCIQQTLTLLLSLSACNNGRYPKTSRGSALRLRLISPAHLPLHQMQTLLTTELEFATTVTVSQLISIEH